MALTLTHEQTKAIVATERVVSIFSILGIFFILITFYFLRSFNKPINRLVFYASFGNLGMNIACLISNNGVNRGPMSALCQFQAFLIQMFLGVDAFWSCCMAWNVYLAFFRKYTDKQLQALDKWYLLGCYGASFVPALTFLFIDTQRRGKIYGPAILWCWIDIKWDFLRIALLYGIVWIAIIFAFSIYIKAGREIWRRRDQLNGFLNPLNENPFQGTITTEVDITVEAPRSRSHSSNPNGDDEFPGIEPDSFDPYTVNVEVGQQPKEQKPSNQHDILRMRTLTREAAMNETTNPGAWLYARVAFLFFLSMLVIWIPSSVNRAYALAHPSKVNFGLNYVSALVLPMQGLLNFIVYIITSRTASCQLWQAIRGRAKLPLRQKKPHHPSDSTIKLASKLDLSSKLDRFETRRTSERLDSELSVPMVAHVLKQ